MLTPADKQIVAGYMGWFKHIYFYKYDEPIYFQEGVAGDIVFDLNNAALCVEKMMEKGDWDVFYQNGMGQYALIDGRSGIKQQDYVAWLFNSQNFFAAMAAWLRGK